MEATKYLERIGRIDVLIWNKTQDRKKWEDLAQSISASTDGERVQSSSSQQKMADAVGMVCDIDMEISKLINERKAITDTIDLLEKNMIDILYKRYVHGIDLYQISIDDDRPMSTIKRRHRKALKAVQEILDERN